MEPTELRVSGRDNDFIKFFGNESARTDILTPTDVDHHEDLDTELDIMPDLLVDLFMQNDRNVMQLHPGSKPPEKGFLERHKVLGVFLIGAAAILTVGLVAGGLVVGLGGLTLLGLVVPEIPIAVVLLWCFFGAGMSIGMISGLGVGVGFATGFLIHETFKQNLRISNAAQILEQNLRKQVGAEETRARTRTAKELFKEMGTVRVERYGRRSVAEVDFLVKYSQLPSDLKRDLLVRFFNERTAAKETPATLLRSEEREFESTEKLHNGGLLDTLSTRLRIDRADIRDKEVGVNWGDYYKDIFAIVQQNTFYQALPKERRAAIEALSNYPATQLFHASQDLQAVQEAVTNDGLKALQEEMLKVVQAPPIEGEQVTFGPEVIQEWMTSEAGQKAIKDGLDTLSRAWSYVPIIPRTPLPT